MFDIGFMELLLISMIALLVLGPEKLPHAVRTATLWIGRARRSFNKVKSEIEQQLNTDEIRRQLHNETILADLEKAKKKAEDLASETRKSLNELGDEVTGSTSGVTRKGNEAKEEKEKEKEKEEKKAISTPASDQQETNLEENTKTPADSDNMDSADESDASAPAEEEPATDFYNNPGSNIVQVKGGDFHNINIPEEKPVAGKSSAKKTAAKKVAAKKTTAKKSAGTAGAAKNGVKKAATNGTKKAAATKKPAASRSNDTPVSKAGKDSNEQ